MKKYIITWLITLLLTTTLSAQLSVEGKIGINSYTDSGSYSENLLQGGFAVSYAWNRVSLRPSFNMGQLQNKHSECYYSEDYINTNLDLMYRISDGLIKLYGYVGGGYTNIGNEHDLLNLTAGGVAKIYFADTFYFLADVSGSSLYGLSHPLGFDRDTAPRGTQAVNIVYSAGIGFDILKPKKKQPQKIIERHIITKVPIVTNEICCDDSQKEFKYTVFFKEGEPKKNQDCEMLISDKNINQLAKAEYKMQELDSKGINYESHLDLYSCHKHGTPESNKLLRLRRGKCVADHLGKDIKMNDQGTTVKCNHIPHQRAVEIVIKIIE